MSPTPLSDAALDDFPEFVASVRSRLEKGRKDYGDASFERPIQELIDELRQEALDLCGWSFIVWVRLNRMEPHDSTARVDAGHGVKDHQVVR